MYVPGSLVKNVWNCLGSGNLKLLNRPVNKCLEYLLCPSGTFLSNQADLWLAAVILRAAIA
jgi:hypothetical protein